MRILVSIPTYESIEPDTFKSVYGLRHHGHAVLFDFTRGYDCAKARNEIARECLDGGYDAVLMVDSDIVLPSDALACLTEPAVDVCLGVYPRKRTVTGQSEMFSSGQDFTDENNIPMVELTGRVRVKGGGLGCALIRRRVLESLPSPWFKYVTYQNGMVLSEDLYFCDQASKAGFEVWADGRVRCGHVWKETHYA